jgi:PAS domain S-box-containing protein
MPFAAVAAVFAVQALAQVDPVVAFPLYLTIVLLTSLQPDRAQSFAVAAVASVAVIIRPLASDGDPSDVASAVLLGIVLLGVAITVAELTRHARATAAAAQGRLDELAASDRRLRAALESAEVGLGLSDLGGKLIQVNERMASLVGRGRDEIVGGRLGDFASESDRAVLAEGLAMLQNSDVTRWQAEISQARADGSVIPVALFLARLPNTATGEPVLLVQETDISDRRRADTLRECLAAVRQIIVNSSGVDVAMPPLLSALCAHLGWNAALHWGGDADGKTIRVRHTANLAGAPVDGFLHAGRAMGAKEGSGIVGRAWQTGLVTAEAEVGRAADYPLRTAARSAGLRSSVAFPVVAGGEVIGVIELLSETQTTPEDDLVQMLATAGVEIGQFISRAETAQALRRSEADHRTMFERSPIGIARISSGGEMLEANAALLHMLEHDVDTMRASAWPDLLRAYDQAASRSQKAPFLAGITDGSSLQVRAATASGKWLWLQLTATSIPDSSGSPEHMLVMIEDVTAVRETSDRLAEALQAQRDANTNLETMDRTKSEFLSIVSHEFRTALTGIQGFSELIRDGGLESDEVRAYGGYIFNDADRVNRLIGDMLDLDRMESGRMSMRSTDVDINDVLMEAISRAAPAAVSVEFKSDLDPRLPIVAGDRDRLIQVVSNIVNNAVKYSPEGGTVTLSSRVEGRFALISVTDTGIGIPQDEISYVFERFRRVRSGAAQSIPGTGLGLTIVKQIVEMHGGRIWVESAVGHGSSFHFTIPLAPESANALQLRHA